jgi:tetrahydromethanopterin S-methyltransferase subunit G
MIYGSRKKMVLPSVVIGLFILIIPVFVLEKSSNRELDTARAKLRELTVLSSEYRNMKERIDSIEKRAELTKVDGTAQAMDNVMSSLGIKGKMKSVKALGRRDIKDGMTEESAEVQIEKVNMNEMVNIFHKIGDAPMILSVKRAMIKKSFEKPELLDISMTVSLFTRK